MHNTNFSHIKDSITISLFSKLYATIIYIYIYCQYCIIYLNIKLKISYSLLVFYPTYLQVLRSILPFCSLNYHLYDMNLLSSFNKISFHFGKLWQFLVTSKVVAFTKMLHSEISQIRIFDPWLIAVAMALNTTIITEDSEICTGLSTKNSSGNSKVPNPTKHFVIRCENLFYFMR